MLTKLTTKELGLIASMAGTGNEDDEAIKIFKQVGTSVRLELEEKSIEEQNEVINELLDMAISGIDKFNVIKDKLEEVSED